ncbi:Muscle M-line assembly protein unc-89-like protein [Dinothrombium tinctorium]|uniref:Muscle M-line assembly protein unc-89-like protein n=1 Tax=Dinothrombium tinctorium TaxID=1965070 RepID=A0A443QW55_9ACAR|nr:Muscle M-line assembly protein unc-89-like protein [Dinothrombium tinctorium]
MLNAIKFLIDSKSVIKEVSASVANEESKISSSLEEKEKPVFKKPLNIVSEHSGETASFECEIESSSPLSVQWMKNNEKISSSDRLKVSSIGKKHTLTVKNINAEDASLYTIVATNEAGSVSSSATLSVKPGDSRPCTPGGTLLPHAPVFKIKLKDTELIEDSTVRFELLVRGMPHPTIEL